MGPRQALVLIIAVLLVIVIVAVIVGMFQYAFSGSPPIGGTLPTTSP